MSELTEPMTIDVVSDVVCPWCYIGKHRLEAALAERPAKSKAVVRWHPFQLNPDLPLGGVDRRSYLANKFGGPEQVARLNAGRALRAGGGIWFEFERIDRQPNTMNAHRLIAWGQAARPSLVSDLVERLFRAYFSQGVDIGNIENWSGSQASRPDVPAKSMLAAGEGRAAAPPTTRPCDGHRRNPLFIFNQRLAGGRPVP
jgi:predicted DsbA family dithiol-disulfide isomerase